MKFWIKILLVFAVALSAHAPAYAQMAGDCRMCGMMIVPWLVALLAVAALVSVSIFAFRRRR